ncbi:MAG: acylphosphatase [Candidatus Nanoarchaeia archaeon]|nr:acylphosphatase [Candidatus Nanoarchaeia archaeon]
MIMKSVQIIISGDVQGVSFRDSTRTGANIIGIKGFVRNLSGGSVEIIAKGTEEQIKKLIELIKTNPGSSKVKEINVKDYNSEINEENFEIKY